MSSPQTLQKKERLKSRKLIDQVFKKGKSLFVHPIKLVYLEFQSDESSESSFSFAVSVPKRSHRKASTRNLLKRRIREAFRKNKPAILKTQYSVQPRWALMYILIDKEVTDFDVLTKSMSRLNKKLTGLIE